MDESLHDAVRAQVERITACDTFEASDRNKKFLEYVVEETLSGRADRIKAYTVATLVFGRGEDFDPQLDPVVRIEAHRLRRALDYYYLTTGQSDPIRIEIPKGGYIPSFTEQRDKCAPAPAPMSAKRSVPSGIPTIMVRPFEVEFDQSGYPNVTRGFTRQIVAGLARFSGIRALGVESAPGGDAVREDDLQRPKECVDFIVSGGCAIADETFSVEVFLTDASSGDILWGETFEHDLKAKNLIKVRDEVANDVVRAIAQIYGIVFNKKIRDIEGKLPEELSPCECVLSFYEYWRTFDRGKHAQVVKCLERTVARDPQYAEAFACLSQAYCDAYRFRFAADAEQGAMLEKSLAMARHAIALAPRSSRAHHALAMAYWFSGDTRAGIDALKVALALNPNATEVMADLGQRYAMLGDWDHAVPLLEKSYERNPAQPGTYRVGLFLYHFAHGRFAEALSEARKVKAPDVVYGYLVEAMALAALGRKTDALACLEKVAEIEPHYPERVVADLTARGLDRALVDKVVNALQNAGMPVQIGLVEKKA